MQVNFIRRSAWLLHAAGIVLAMTLGGCGGGDSSGPSTEMLGAPAPPTSLPVTIKNTSGQTVYVKFTGDMTKTFTVTPTTATIATGGAATFNVTNISAGRIYLSYGKALSTDAPDGANPTDPDFHTRFDKVELTFTPITHVAAGKEAVVHRDVPLFELRAERRAWDERTHRRFIQSTRAP